MTDRSRFGSWGVELNDDDLARAIVQVLEQRNPNATWSEPVVVDSWEPPLASATFYTGLPPQWLRFQVDAQLYDLAEWIARRNSGAASVFIERPSESGIVWTYPIRVGLLPGHRDLEVREIANLSWDDVYEIVELSAGQTECDLLLLPGSLRSSLAAVLAYRLPIHADCVMVMGMQGESGIRALQLIDVLCEAADATGVVVANQRRQWRVSWFHDFVQQLTHDKPLDVAAFRGMYSSIKPPLVVASRRLINATRITTNVAQMADLIQWMETPEITVTEPMTASPEESIETRRGARPHDVAWNLRTTLDHAFNSELGPASEIGRFSRSLPPDLRVAPGRLQRDPGDRRVVAETLSQSETVETLRPVSTYQLKVRIGFGQPGEAVATKAFPHDLLPLSPNGHMLTVVFAELPQADEHEFAQPQVRELRLPPAEESDPVDFWFRTGENVDRYEARVIVLHQNRVLQTLRYGGEFGQTIALAPELDVYDLGNLEGRTRFDAAIVQNKANARTGVCVIADGKVAYVAPAGLDTQVERVSAVLDQATKMLKLPKKLGDTTLMKVMLSLSHEGNQLWTALGMESAKDKLAAARRIQVVAAQPGEYLPVEFLYTRPVPLKLALCKHAVGVLSGATVSKCPTTTPENELCPVEFWGLSRVIEHVAFIGSKRKSSTSPKTKPLFQSAVIGISNKVPARDRKKLVAALDTATGKNAYIASSWTDWAGLIQKQKPPLLVLLTHSTVFQLTGGSALELAGDILPIAGIEEKHVRAAGTSDEPVVLLLGCDVVRAPIVYQNAVERLKAMYAGVVLGTLSTVLGPHAVSFAVALVEALSTASGRATKFGDVLLDVKRKRISAGDPFALTLVAYGDSEIRV